MDPSNSELASQLFAAFNRRDLDGALALVHDEVEFIAPTAEIANDGRPYRGHAGMEKYYADAARVWIELEVMPREYREVGDAAGTPVVACNVGAVSETLEGGRLGALVPPPTPRRCQMRLSRRFQAPISLDGAGSPPLRRR